MAVPTKSQANKRLVFFDTIEDHKPFISLFQMGAVDARAKDFKLLSGDCLFFEGGTDIQSGLYGEPPHAHAQAPDKARDAREVQWFYDARKMGLLMVGICRGAQLLNVLNGGKLIQHMEGHTNCSMHLVVDRHRNVPAWKTICDHHQSCILGPGGESLFKAVSDDTIEGYLYKDTKCLGIQGHPAWGYNEAELYEEYCIDLVEQFLISEGRLE